MSDHLERCLLYSSGELGEVQRLAHQLHRQGCQACRELEESLAMGSRVAGAARLELPARARTSSVARTRSAEPAPSWTRVLAVAAAAALAIALWPRARAVPAWNELDQDVARLGEELDRLSRDIGRSETDLEIEAELRQLDGKIDGYRGAL